METESCENVAKILHCIKCDYTTSRKSSYDKHILTAKHQKLSVVNISLTQSCEKDENNDKFLCQYCNKEYQSRVGLWKHKKRCNTNETTIESNSDVKVLTNLVLEIVKQNQDLMFQNNETQKQNQELQKHVIELCKNGTHNTMINNNSHNKAFNLNFFLNETCKNAMNITEFVDSIQLQLSDFENVGDIGFVNGISNIIIKNLKALDITKRPVHCTDQKRETIYIKDENKWEKEDEKNQKLRKVIKKVVSKNHRLILKFREVYPDYNKYSSPNSTRYDKIIIEAMGGLGNNDLEKEDKIIRNIVKNIGIDK